MCLPALGQDFPNAASNDAGAHKFVEGQDILRALLNSLPRLTLSHNACKATRVAQQVASCFWFCLGFGVCFLGVCSSVEMQPV